jgi:hypothetical protein
MAEQQLHPQSSLAVSGDQALIGLVFHQDGREVTRYFADEASADAAVAYGATDQALQMFGEWHDLDWEEMATALDHIRHESPPSLPIEV